MKNLYKLLVIIGFVSLSFTSCEKDIVVIDAFNFEIEEIHQEITTINYPQETKLSILAEKPLASDNYFFSYIMLEGQGAFIIDGSPVSQNEHIEIESPELEFNMNFVSSSLGIKKVRIEINNNGKVIKEIDLVYDVRHNPYSLTMTSPVTDYTENQVIPIKVNLQNVGVDNNVVYKRAFFLLEGEGVLTGEGQTDPTPLEQFLPIEEGETNYSLEMSTLGTARFLVRTIDSNGQVKEAILEFNGISQDLTFTVVTNPSNLFVNSDFAFEFSIPVIPGVSGNKMSYVIDTGDLEIEFGGALIAQNEQVDVPDSGNFSWSGLSNIEQDLTITFTLESGGDQISRDLVLSFQARAFNLEMIPDSIDASVNEAINITGTISQSSTPGGNHFITVTSDKLGEITHNGAVVTLGTAFPVTLDSNLRFTMTYKGLEPGEHELNFIAVNAIGESSNVETFKMNFTP